MSIQVWNLQSGETVTYSLPLLVGEVTPPLTQATIVVRQGGRCLAWPIHNGQFKLLVQLKPGENHLTFSFYGITVDFLLHYEVPKWTKFVRPIYLIASEDDGHFQGPANDDTSPASATQRIALAAKMLQTFTAEKLHEHGLGRRTFVLENDLYPERPPCMVFRSRIKVAEAFKMTGGDLWMYFAKELMSSRNLPDKENCKWFAFISFTRYQPPADHVPRSHSEILKHTKGHTALGGGGLALFGTGNLQTWAERLEDVSPCFTNNNKIDRTKFMDDSAYRQTYWANYSTGLGASLHELGHTFDLAHTPTGIMARGFDDLYKVFTLQPQASRGESQNNSRLSSPGPYTPRQSPIHRSRIGSSGSSAGITNSISNSRSESPIPCPLSQNPLVPSTMESLNTTVVQIETAFKRVQLDSSQTMTVLNYDGSETQRTIIKHRDGTETVTEVTIYPSTGERVAKEMIKNLATGKTRTTMSMSSSLDLYDDLRDDSSSSSCSSSSSASLRSPEPGRSPASSTLRSPDDGSFLNFQQVQYKDGGAHWYRASAIMLRYHKWFNPAAQYAAKPPVLNGNVIESAAGLRLVELRSLPESMVIHHWEFLHAHPPTCFTLRHSEVRDITNNATDVTVVAVDNQGNLTKKKVKIETLDVKGHQRSLSESGVFHDDAKGVMPRNVISSGSSPARYRPQNQLHTFQAPKQVHTTLNEKFFLNMRRASDITLHIYHSTPTSSPRRSPTVRSRASSTSSTSESEAKMSESCAETSVINAKLLEDGKINSQNGEKSPEKNMKQNDSGEKTPQNDVKILEYGTKASKTAENGATSLENMKKAMQNGTKTSRPQSVSSTQDFDLSANGSIATDEDQTPTNVEPVNFKHHQLNENEVTNGAILYSKPSLNAQAKSILPSTELKSKLQASILQSTDVSKSGCVTLKPEKTSPIMSSRSTTPSPEHVPTPTNDDNVFLTPEPSPKGIHDKTFTYTK